MAARQDAAFEAFVAREHDDLLRLAVLLADDRDDAADLTRGTLAAVRARWRRLAASADPADAARRTLVRRATGRRTEDGPRTSGWVTDAEPLWGVDEHDDVRRALADLPPTARAAVVLTVWGDRSEEEAADVLRRPVEVVREEVAGAVARLSRAQVPLATSWWSAPALPAADPRAQVRLSLAALAEADLPPAAEPADVAEAARRVVSTRRRRAWLAGLAAACAGAVVAVPALTGVEPAPPRVSAEESQEPVEGPAQFVDLSVGPTRGSLAGDRAFLEGVLERPWENEHTGDQLTITTSAATRRVLFAGDLPAGRWALVAGRPVPSEAVEGLGGGPYVTDELAMAWFTGPRGARPEQMEMTSWPFPPMSGFAPSFLDPRTGSLVVVAEPGDTVEVSQRVEISEDGSRDRVWEEVPVDDGVAVAALEAVDLPWNWSVSYRVLRDGSEVATGVPDGPIPDPEDTVIGLDIDYPDGTPTDRERDTAEQAAFTALATVGIAPSDARLTARLVRTLTEPVPGAVAIVTAELPDGAVVIGTHYTQELGGDFVPMDCGLDVRPAGGAPPAERVTAAVCQIRDSQSGSVVGGLLVLTAPPSVSAVRTYRLDDELIAEHELSDGVLVVPTPPGTVEVEALTTAGVQLGRTRVLGHWTPSD